MNGLINKYYVDGFVFGGNPSRHGGGFTVCDEHGTLIKREVITRLPRPIGFTNNDGELLAIQYACEIATPNSIIYTDSRCAQIWAKSGKCKARPDLTPIARDCFRAIWNKNLKLEWVGREANLAGHINDLEKENVRPNIKQITNMQTFRESLEQGFVPLDNRWVYKFGDGYELNFERLLFDNQYYVALYKNEELLTNKVIIKPGKE